MTDHDRAELNFLDTEPEGEDTMLRPAIERMPALLGPEDGADSRDGGKGAQLILVPTPTKAWSTEDLKDFAGTIQGCLNDGDDPAMLMPVLEDARTILRVRGEL